MDLKQPNQLRISGTPGDAETPPAGDSALRGPAFPVNDVAELVADLVEATGLVSPDRLAAVRGRVKQGGSFAQAVLDEGVATSEGLARTLASRFQLPFVDLPLVGVEQEAAEQVAVHVLERVIAIPYALDGETLRVAVADPGNVHATDELRLARARSSASSAPPRRSARAPRSTRRRASSARRRRRRTATTSRSTTGSRTSRSSGSSTRSSSRPRRTGPATSTSSPRRTRSPSGCGSTACCTRCSASRSG